jgi:alpha-acetolactate decarboxylase
MILTRDEMNKRVMQALENSVQHIPEEKREEIKAKILGTWSGQMFSMDIEEKKK